MTLVTAGLLWFALSCLATPLIGAFLSRQSSLTDSIADVAAAPVRSFGRGRATLRASATIRHLNGRIAVAPVLPGSITGPALQ